MAMISNNPPVGCPMHNKMAQAPVAAAETPAPAAPVDSRDPAGLAEKLQDERGATIPCPFWRVMINEDVVDVAKDGSVSMGDVRKALKEAGVSFGLRETAMLGIKHVAAQMAGAGGGLAGLMATFHADRLNVLDLPHSSLMHTGDSGTLRGGFHQENLDKLLSYSSDGVNVTIDDLAKANKAQVEADPGASGRGFGVAEYSILVNVFGSKNEDGVKYLSKKDLTTLFKDNKFPEDWKKNSVGFLSLGTSVAHIFGEQKKLSATDGPGPTAGLDKPAATSKSCPFLTGQPFDAEGTAKQHGDVKPQ